MAIKALADNDFPSRSRQELYGDDMLVHVWWKDNPMFCAAATFRAPTAMTWADFKAGMIDPWAASDPAYDPSFAFDWGYDGGAFSPRDDATLADLGVGHKHTISMAGGNPLSQQ